MSSENAAPPALTMLSEEEAMFRDAIRDFAQAEIQPKSREMEKNACYDESLLKSLFEMGLMGIEIPEELGGAGASFFQACLAVEEDPPNCSGISMLIRPISNRLSSKDSS